MWTPAAVAAATLCGLGSTLEAQQSELGGRGPVTIEGITFVPSTFHVGDVVEVRVDMSSQQEPGRPIAADTGPWLVLHDLALLPRGGDRWELRIAFSVFQAGVRTLPPIDLSTFRIENLKVQADSVLGAGDESTVDALRPLHPQVAMPGTAAAILLALLLILVAPTALAMLSLRLLAAVRRLLAERAQALPRLRLERTVRRQLARVTEARVPVSAEAFFVELSRTLRTYLEAALSIPAHASTTHELEAAFASTPLHSAQSGELAEILETADRVKFRGDSAEATQMVTTGERLIALVADVERALVAEAANVES